VRKYLAVALLAWAVVATAFAVEPNERLADPALEARARALSEELRCLVCQNETIDESGAPLAHDLRVLLRQRIAAGDTDAQAVKFLTDRYGDFVLLKPPVEPANYALWFGPIAVLVLSAIGAWIYLRRRRIVTPPAPLSAEEQRRVERLLADEPGDSEALMKAPTMKGEG
jgi:cytochrome c-type biogenesis protein CcmH